MNPSSSPVPSPSRNQKPSAIKRIIVVLGVSFLFVSSGLGAIALGIIWAQKNPVENADQPLFLKLLHRIHPDVPKTPSEAPTILVNPVLDGMTPEKKAAINQELNGILDQIQVLKERTEKLEQELQLSTTASSLETRIAQIQKQLTTTAAPTAIAASNLTSTDTNQPVKITLPSSLLFAADGQTLTKNAQDILDAIAIDLQQSSAKTITIAGHSFPSNNQDPQQLSFQQAQAIRVYLAKRVPGNHRWMLVGYGATRPIIDGNNEANQRIEITAD